jgi:hypothetical protein
MLMRALNVAKKIEPESDYGALWCRIQLNLAIVDLERGRVRRAKGNLEIIAEKRGEHPVITNLAVGFIGLTEALAGNQVKALSAYEQSIKQLAKWQKTRSVAILSRHLCDFLRTKGCYDAERAKTEVQRSILMATKGGHEDVLQYARLANIRLSIAGVSSDSSTVINDQLDALANYGKQMGLPRMQADIAYARALNTIKSGDKRYAAKHALECLKFSIQHDLKLRQVTSLILLAQIYEPTELQDLAKPLKIRALNLADRCGYSGQTNLTL